MLITLTCYAPNAPDVGYLFGKNPASLFARDFSGGRRPRLLSRGRRRPPDHRAADRDRPDRARADGERRAGLDQYVNDRPYVASSLTSVALNVAFGSALARQEPRTAGAGG